tara:strand:+ start:503 stop:754 length:252 start_codon:yes stop_codon:yes gene_type:complete
MSKMSDLAIEHEERTEEESILIEDFIDSVDIFYTQFLEIAFFLKVTTSEKMAISFVKRKLPLLTKEQIQFLIEELTKEYRENL